MTKRKAADECKDLLTESNMHPRNVYRDNPPNFKELAKQFESFRPFVYYDRYGPHIDFKDANAVRELTQCLLKRDFDLDLKIPLDSLCPAVSNRLNYILWLQDLLDETMPEEQEIAGIDIGVGASCIYPLLGCATRSNWKFMGTGQDIDERSIQYARKNVMRNHLEDRIKIKHNDNPERILLLDGDESYHFCMCNPPFYSSREEIDEGLQNKELEPSAVCTGTDNEMITTGGEYGFIKRMINESLTYKTRIKWYTSMMGQKKTIKPLVDLLKSMDITNYVVTEFCQGRTKRWGIAWSFDSTRVVCAKSLDSYRPKSQFSIHFSKPVIDVQSMLKDILNDLDITFTERDEVTVEGEPVSNTWSRAARRQKKLKLDSSSQLQDTEPLFAFRFEFLETADCEIRVSWMRGKDRAIFESFWNHIKKRLEEGCGIIHGSAFAK